MSSRSGRKLADGQRVPLRLAVLLCASTVPLELASKRPHPAVNKVLDRVFPIFSGRIPREGTVEDIDAGGRPARLYSPPRPTGLLVYLHGGGYVFGGLASHGGTAAFIAAATGCKVLAISYRKAPRDVFPAAADDCLAGFRWVVRNAARFGVEAEQIAIGGDSAGGQLAVGVCLALADEEVRPRCAWLLYPITDADSGRYRSATLFEAGPLLSRRSVDDMVSHYATAPEARVGVTVIEASGLERMPSTYVATAGMDPIRDQGEAFADRLSAAGVPVVHQRFANLPHGFSLLLIDPHCRRATTEACAALQRALST